MSMEARGLHRAEHRLLLLVGDGIAAVAAIVISLWLWSFTAGFPFGLAFVTAHAAWLIAVPIWLAVVSPTRALQKAHSPDATLRGLLSAAAGLLAIYVALYFYAPPAALARLPALYFTWEALLLTAAARLVYLFVLGRGTLRRRVAIVGNGARAEAAVALLRAAAQDVIVAAVVSDDLDDVVSDDVAELVVATDAPPSPAVSERLLQLQYQGIDVVPFATEYEHRLQRVPVAYLDPDWAFTSLPDWVRSRDASRLLKRTLDIAGGLIGLAVLGVLFVPIASLIWLESGRPIFYRQQRVGRGRRRFDVLKFRTMIQGAESDGVQFARPDDPRATRFGRWLRRSRLDEWPQVLNVLKGDMSLVGPRPERPEFADDLAAQIPFYRTRLMVAPGLSGWAQVNAEYGDSPEAQALKLEYDLYYIKHRSLVFDLWILLRTIGTVIGLRGR
jgi:exopolysaccharide biosynthesis polyprenyl glycosylphosphotransferase